LIDECPPLKLLSSTAKDVSLSKNYRTLKTTISASHPASNYAKMLHKPITGEELLLDKKHEAELKHFGSF
jgi:hypothetical protein